MGSLTCASLLDVRRGRVLMISLEYCVGLCGLSPEEIEAIGEHEDAGDHHRCHAWKLPHAERARAGKGPGHDHRRYPLSRSPARHPTCPTPHLHAAALLARASG